jgi:TolB-like protein
MTSTRRLAAILVADVVGYSRLMEADEAGTLAALKERRKTILEPVVKEHGGRVVKLMGDGVLVEFASAVEAVKAAITLQQRFEAANTGVPDARHVRLRIGINLGDVIGEGSDIYGDGVNIASRLEAIAEPGGICISAKVHDEARGKLDAFFEEMGAQALRNIATPVRVFRIHPAKRVNAIPLPAGQTQPSIAVLPFLNMSGDPEQEYFADGLTEDIITDLSNVSGLFVIARNSVFTYKGKSQDVHEIGRRLRVKFVLLGSVRRSDTRLRINVQLVDAVGGGGHLWAERFDREFSDVFSMQDEIARRVVAALSSRLVTGLAFEQRQRPSNLIAYELCLRSRSLRARSIDNSKEARSLLQQAVSLDETYCEAHWRLALLLTSAWLHEGEEDKQARQLAVYHAERAVELDADDSGAHAAKGFVLTYERRWDEASACYEQSMRLNPNDADTLAQMSDFKVIVSEPQEAVEFALRALRLNPIPPSWYYWFLGQAQIAAGKYEDAVITLSKEETYRTASRRDLCVALAKSGRTKEARREAKYFTAANPNWSIGYYLRAEGAALRNPRDAQFWADGYRKAGLPE